MPPSFLVSGRRWADQPAALLGWAVLLVILLAYALGLDRSSFIDQPNYLENFANAVTLEWTHDMFAGSSLLTGIVVGIFSEEALWQVWATVLGALLSPPAAVVVTVCAISLLLALAVVRLPNPVLPLILWILLPFGFAAIGLLQLRQGFAFAVMLYVALRFNRPILGALLASMIHTTFVLAVAFAGIAWLCGRRRLLAVVLAVAFALLLAYLGSILFATFGGRRLQTYSANEAETNSILYVFGALLCSLPSLHRLLHHELASEAEMESVPMARTLGDLAVVHIGVIAFIVICYFIFPLGAGRIAYLVMLLLIPILPTMHRRGNPSGTILYSALLVYLVYVTIKTYLEGTYDILFGT
jgi:hypothetical protein